LPKQFSVTAVSVELGIFGALSLDSGISLLSDNSACDIEVLWITTYSLSTKKFTKLASVQL
jgi:hypothetical protein